MRRDHRCPQVRSGNEPRCTVFSRGFLPRDEKSDSSVSADLVLVCCYRCQRVVVYNIVSVELLRSCAGADREDDRVIELRFRDRSMQLGTHVRGDSGSEELVADGEVEAVERDGFSEGLGLADEAHDAAGFGGEEVAVPGLVGVEVGADVGFYLAEGGLGEEVADEAAASLD